jgi:hypothetical protein
MMAGVGDEERKGVADSRILHPHCSFCVAVSNTEVVPTRTFLSAK